MTANSYILKNLIAIILVSVIVSGGGSISSTKFLCYLDVKTRTWASSHTSRAAVDCNGHCVRYDSCVAVNYNRLTSECQVVLATPHSVDIQILVQHNWSNYWRQGLCPDGWHTSVHFSCYLLVAVTLDWLQADSTCQTNGAHLAYVETAEENSYLNNLIISMGHTESIHFLGGILDNNGDWVWSNGLPMLYVNWADNEPSGFGEKYLSIFEGTSGLWNDVGSESTGYCICEKPYLT